MKENIYAQKEKQLVIKKYQRLFWRKLSTKQRIDLVKRRNYELGIIDKRFSKKKKQVFKKSLVMRNNLRYSQNNKNTNTFEYSKYKPTNVWRITSITKWRLLQISRHRELIVQQLRRKQKISNIQSESNKLRRDIMILFQKNILFKNIIKRKEKNLYSQLRILHNNKQYSLVNQQVVNYQKELENITKNYLLQLQWVKTSHSRMKEAENIEKYEYIKKMRKNNTDTQFQINKIKKLKDNWDIEFQNMNNIIIKSQEWLNHLFDYQSILAPNAHIKIAPGHFIIPNKWMLIVSWLKISWAWKWKTTLDWTLDLAWDKQSLSNVSINAWTNERWVNITKNNIKISNVEIKWGRFAIIINNWMHSIIDKVQITQSIIDGIQIKWWHGTRISNCIIKDFAKYWWWAHRDWIQILAWTSNKSKREWWKEIIKWISIQNCKIEAPEWIIATQVILINAIIKWNIVWASTDHWITIAAISSYLEGNRVYSYENENIKKEWNAAINLIKSNKAQSRIKIKNNYYSVKIKNNSVDTSWYWKIDKKIYTKPWIRIDKTYKLL